MYADPDPPKPRPTKDTIAEERPDGHSAGPLDDMPTSYRFNPEYGELIDAWDAVKPQLDRLRTVLDKAYGMAVSPQTWDAPVGERYVQDIREWRNRLIAYRHSVLTTISDAAADTPRWIRIPAGSLRAQ
ncbi:hypothetical protein [Nonomuraea sp. SYSU D8015]|uniref:hypothetical protein n=1 Tax=Nonomuraea sp. SYSU D8015 TaxID=2593644 RepID=UPI0016608BBD|nr:hypothetical protein [Nonomuraea sp. SYSU D8015]